VDRRSALFGCLVFFFSSYVWGQLFGHLNLSFIVAVPFLILVFVLRLKDKLTRPLFLIASSILLVFQFGVSNEIFATFIFLSFIAIILAILFFSRLRTLVQKLVRTAIELLISIAMAVVILFPYLVLMLKDAPGGTINSASVYSTDALNLIIPTVSNWLFGEKFSSVSSQFTGNGSEQGAYIGLPVVILLLMYFAKHFYFRRSEKSKYILFLFVLTAITFLLSIGPSIHFLQTQISSHWLLWKVVERLPLIRYALPVRLCLYTQVISSVIVMFWFNEAHRKWVKYGYAALVLIFILPNPKIIYPPNIDIPEFFTGSEYRKAIKQGENVLILPTYSNGGVADFYQAITNFYFNIAEETAGLPPEAIRKNPVCWLGNQSVSKSDFIDYMEKLKVAKIIAVGDLDKYSKELLDSVGLNQPVKYSGNISVYTVESGQLEKVSNEISKITNKGIDFTDKGNASAYHLVGFSNAENWGTWSENKMCSLTFRFPKSIPSKAVMHLIFHGLVTPAHSQHYVFFMNRKKVFENTYTTWAVQNISLDLGDELQIENTFTIQSPDAASPESLELNGDTRKLGIGLISLSITPL